METKTELFTMALVTLYFPNNTVQQNINQLSKLVDRVVLLDNTPNNDNFSLFVSINDNIEYIAYKQNMGLSSAFNRYLEKLNENCYIIFFDQDSYCPYNLIDQLKEDYAICCEKLKKKGILGPAYFEVNANRLMLPRQKKKVSNGVYQVSSIITSGMFTELQVLREVNFWNEEIFLDLSDWDICWRINEGGFFCCLSENVILRHSLGNCTHKIGFLKIKEGAVFRVYYQTRDCLFLLKKKYVPVKFKVRFFFMLTIRPIIHFIFLPNKFTRFNYFIRGIKDYKKKKHGVLIN